MHVYSKGLSLNLVETISKYTDFLHHYTHTEARTKYSKLLVKETSVVDALSTKTLSSNTKTYVVIPS